MNIKIKTIAFLLTSLFCIQLLACTQESETQAIKNQNETEYIDTMKLKITIGTSSFSATLQNNATANAFKERLPLTLTMTELNNNEKYADLVESLPTNAFNPGTIQNGDLMLYGSNTLVLFYKTFSTSYNYTKIGKTNNPEGLLEILGSGNVAVTFEIN
ncbi:MAG TPA: cyclophilin-like fold protein [Lachnospiraceae bacterium]|nr:cyclophilin-like fold protein [Lachnospiraceae bacterium]